MTEVVVLILGLAALLAAIVIVPPWLNARARIATLSVIAEASAKGRELDPGVVDQLLAKPRPRVGKWYAVICLVLGLPALGVGLGLLLGAQLFPEGAARAGMTLGGAINAATGIGLTTLGLASLRWLAPRGQAERRLDGPRFLALTCLFLGVAGLSTGVGLALGSLAWTPLADPDGTIRDGVLLGGLIDGLSGAGLAILGVFILRLFADDAED